MDKATWLVPGLTAVILLFVGVVLFFGMIVALNGFSGDAGVMLVAYLVLLVATVVFSVWASRWGFQGVLARTQWSIWICAPVTVAVTVIVATGILLLDMALVILIGMEVFGLR